MFYQHTSEVWFDIFLFQLFPFLYHWQQFSPDLTVTRRLFLRSRNCLRFDSTLVHHQFVWWGTCCSSFLFFALCPMLTVSLDCPFLIASSIFFTKNVDIKFRTHDAFQEKPSFNIRVLEIIVKIKYIKINV